MKEDYSLPRRLDRSKCALMLRITHIYIFRLSKKLWTLIIYTCTCALYSSTHTYQPTAQHSALHLRRPCHHQANTHVLEYSKATLHYSPRKYIHKAISRQPRSHVSPSAHSTRCFFFLHKKQLSEPRDDCYWG